MSGLAKLAADAVKKTVNNKSVQDATKKFAKSDAVKDLAGKGAAAAGAMVGGSVLKGRGKRAAKKVEKMNRKMAIRSAQQHQGQYSERIVVDGAYRSIVWKDHQPIAAFPPIEGAETPELLQARSELQSVPREWMQDPPTDGPE